MRVRLSRYQAHVRRLARNRRLRRRGWMTRYKQFLQRQYLAEMAHRHQLAAIGMRYGRGFDFMKWAALLIGALIILQVIIFMANRSH